MALIPGCLAYTKHTTSWPTSASVSLAPASSHLRLAKPLAGSALLHSVPQAQSWIKVHGAADLTRLLLQYKRGCDWESAMAALWFAAAEHASSLQLLHANIVLSTLAAAQPAQYERACALLCQMRAMGLRPDPYSYSSTIAACSRAGQPDRALAVFRQCSAEAQADARPNAVVFNAMLLACQRAGPEWQPQLIALFAAMGAHGVQPDAWAYSAALNAYARMRQWRKALELLDVMEQRPSGVGPRPDGHCYAATMRACLHAREHVQVLQLHQRMSAAGVRCTAYTLVPALDACAALARAGDRSQWRRSKQLLEEQAAQADGADLNAHCFSAAARVYAECGRPDLALGLLKQMRTASPPILPNAHVFTAVIASLGPSRNWRVALQLLHGMARAGVAIDAHCAEAALKVLGRAGRWREACQLFRSMASEFDVTPTPIHLTTVLQCLAAAKQWHVGAALLEEVYGAQPTDYAASATPDGAHWSPEHPSHTLAVDARLCAAALNVCANVGAWKRARVLLQAAGEEATPAMRRAAVVALIRASEWSRAEALLDQLLASLVDDDGVERAKLHRLATVIAHRKQHPRGE